LVAATPKRRRHGSYLGEISPAPENLVNRDFTAGAPNEKWLTDISEFHIPAGKVYLSPVIDCFDGKVVSWTISMRPDAQLVNTMLDVAIETIDISNRPVVHSARGAHYRWPGWLARIADAELTRSMSPKGCSPDNAACEGVHPIAYCPTAETVGLDVYSILLKVAAINARSCKNLRGA